MSLYSISIWAGIIGVTLLICYALIKLVVKKEMEKSFEGQIKEVRSLLKNKPLRMVIDIDKNGQVEIKDFQPIERPDYMG